MPQVNAAAAQPALVLLHGMFSGSADWQVCAVRFATHWRVVAPDLPVLLVWGNGDRVTPPDIACEFKQHIPHAELHFIPRCGHAPNIEQPEALSLIVEQFLKRHFSHAYADVPA